MKTNHARIMEYLAGHDKKSSAEIFNKNKDYYMASANKIIARLELAKMRILYMDIPEKDRDMLAEKLHNGFKWLNNLNKIIKNANEIITFQKAVSYKKWHAVKLIPSSAEGYAITASLEGNLKHNNVDSAKTDGNMLKNAIFHNNKAKEIFLELLNLNEDSDFKTAEKRLINAYEELNLASDLLNHKIGNKD